MIFGPWWEQFKRLTGITDDLPDRTQEAAAFNESMRQLRKGDLFQARKTTTKPKQESQS